MTGVVIDAAERTNTTQWDTEAAATPNALQSRTQNVTLVGSFAMARMTGNFSVINILTNVHRSTVAVYVLDGTSKAYASNIAISKHHTN